VGGRDGEWIEVSGKS